MPNINVIGVVSNEAVAEQLIGNLRVAGYGPDQISLIMGQPEPEADPTQTDDAEAEGLGETAAHAATGALAGSGAGVLAGLATLAIPGIGPVIGGGVLLAMFGGMGAGIGGLIGLYSSENESSQQFERYGVALREGQALVSVTVPDQDAAKQAEELLATGGATNINSYLEDQSNVTDAPGVKDVTE
ncbi:MAG: hypothetical protein JOZ51_05695 [Chloroflexi bacterium]|nr:hypothetical protein [Chloroflexota bacterium]